MAAADLAELRRTAEERHLGATLVMAETVAAGCCVVTLAFFPVSTHDEVLPPVYTSGRAEKDGLPQVAVVGVPWASAVQPARGPFRPFALYWAHNHAGTLPQCQRGPP